VRQRSYRELLSATLAAIRDNDTDTEMELRAEIMGRFRRSDVQINPALFRLLTAQESGGGEVGYGAVDLTACEPMHWLVDGFLPAHDQTLLYGEAGAGKTTAALSLAFAVIEGKGFLDRSAASEPARVLFLSSDSGMVPLKEVLHRLDRAEHPALSDGRLTVWAHCRQRGRMAWDASIGGCLSLLEAIRRERFSLVVIDSCKAVCTKADVDYASNPQVTALLTFFQEVICREAAVLWLNHDGVARGAHAGAKAWREIPSTVHAIEVEAPEGGESAGAERGPRRRLWTVRKCRMGSTRRFHYAEESGSGRLVIAEAGADGVVGDCSGALLELLQEALDQGQEVMTTRKLVEQGQRRGYSEKTVWNTLTRLTHGRQLVRRGRGHYALSPKQRQTTLAARVGREEEGPQPLSPQGSLVLPASSSGRDSAAADPPAPPPGENSGRLPIPLPALGSAPFSSLAAGPTPAAVPTPEQVARLTELRRADPHASPYTLALRLDPTGSGRPTGREVAQWLQAQALHGHDPAPGATPAGIHPAAQAVTHRGGGKPTTQRVSSGG
jgi:archaellum biogenesis ATPase FlaH